MADDLVGHFEAAHRPGRGEKTCACCKDDGSHPDGSECDPCDGSGMMHSSDPDVFCPGQPQPRRRHWRQGAAHSAHYLDLYHHTDPESARKITESGRFISQMDPEDEKGSEPHAYFSSREDGQARDDYGYGATVSVSVPAEHATPDGFSPDGELHYKVPTRLIKPEHIFGWERYGSASAPDPYPHGAHGPYEAHVPAAERTESVRHILDHYLPTDFDTWDEVRDNLDFTSAGRAGKLLQHVRANGVQRPVPIDYEQDPPRVMNGHTRLISAEMAGREHVPTRQHQGWMDPDDPDAYGNQPDNPGHWTYQHPEWLREGALEVSASAPGEPSNDYKDALERTAAMDAYESNDIFARPTGKSPVAEHAERILDERSVLTREQHRSLPHPFLSAPDHGPYHVVRDPDKERGDTMHVRERQADYHVVDREGRSVHPYGISHDGSRGMWSGYTGAMDDWHRLTHHEDPADIRHGLNGQPKNPMAVDSVEMHKRYSEHLRANPPQFPHSRVSPYDQEVANRPEPREHAPAEGFREGDTGEQWHGPYEVVRHPQTRRYHVIDNEGYMPYSGDNRKGYESQHPAEQQRDYIDHNRQAKEHGRAMFQRMDEGINEAIDPGSTPEGRKSDKNLRDAQELMTRYEGGSGHVKFDDDEDGGEPYYELEHHDERGQGTGWYAKHYGGPQFQIHHRATGDVAHDAISLPSDNREGKLIEPYGHEDLARDLKAWHDEPGGTRDYYENDKYGRQSEPKIHRWKQRHVGAAQTPVAEVVAHFAQAADDRGANPVDDAMRTISQIAESKGHRPVWTPDDRDGRPSFLSPNIHLSCQDCDPSIHSRVKRLALPQDPAEFRNEMIDDPNIPAWVTRQCRRTKEKARALREQLDATAEERRGERTAAVAEVVAHFASADEMAAIAARSDPGYPNPLTGGSDWFHGTHSRPEDLNHGFDIRSDHDQGDEEMRSHLSYWNNFLGPHFAAAHSLADHFARTGSSSESDEDEDYPDPSSRYEERSPQATVHARLKLRNPKVYASEHDMDNEAYEHETGNGNWISRHFNGYEDEDHTHPEWDPDSVPGDEEWPLAARFRHDDKQPLIGKDEAPIQGVFNVHHPGQRRRAQWLSSHPDKANIAARFRDRLVAQGHDGIIYGNELEAGHAPAGHAGRACAIAFHPGQVEMTQHHETGRSCLPQGEAEEQMRRMPAEDQDTLPGAEEESDNFRGGFFRPRRASAVPDVIAHFAAAGPWMQQKLFHVKPDPTQNTPDSRRYNPTDPDQHLHWRTQNDEDYQPDECEHCGGDRKMRAEHAEHHENWMRDQDWHTDWDEEAPADGEPIHRGMATMLPKALHDRVHDTSIPVAQRAHELASHIASEGGLGNFWSSEPDVSKSYAESTQHHLRYRYPKPNGEAEAQTPVMVHARFPGKEHIETDPEQLQHWGVYSYHLADNREIPIQHEAPMQISGISWADPGHGGKMTYDGPEHQAESKHLDQDSHWTHHDFGDRGIQANASLGIAASAEYGSKPPFIAAPEDATDDEKMAHWDHQRQIKNDWESRVVHGISTGDLHPDRAKELGHYFDGHQTDRWGDHNWRPLPQHLYHVTTDLPGVRASGLKTRDELAQTRGGHGLGGGPENMISLTDDHPTAQNILRSVHEFHHVVNGRYTPAQMWEDAKAGVGARRPFHEDLASYHQSGWKDGDPLPRRLDEAVRGKEVKMGGLLYSPEEMAQHEGPGWIPHHESSELVGRDGVKRHNVWERDANPDLLRERGADFYKNFAAYREHAGGRENPLFFGTDTKAFAGKDPRHFAIVHARPRPGAMGHQVSALGEWRTGTGDAIEAHRAERMEDGHLKEASLQRTATPSFTWKGLTYGKGPEGGYVEAEREVSGPFYHGGRSKDLKPGASLTKGRKTNDWGDEGERSQYIHFTTNLGGARDYARKAGGHVYEIEPTGDVKTGYTGDEWKSEHPLRVIRRVEDDEGLPAVTAAVAMMGGTPPPWEDVGEDRPPVGPWPGGKAFHGTRSILHSGEMLTPDEAERHPAHPMAGGISEGHVHITPHGAEAQYWAEHASPYATHARMEELGRGRTFSPGYNQGHAYPPRVYEVEPAGPVEPDPMGEGHSYRTAHPVRVIRQVRPLECYHPDHEGEEHWPEHPHYETLESEQDDDDEGRTAALNATASDDEDDDDEDWDEEPEEESYRRIAPEEDEHGFQWPMKEGTESGERVRIDDEPPRCTTCAATAHTSHEYHWPEDGHHPDVQARLDRDKAREDRWDRGEYDRTRFCGVGCEQGHHEDQRHGVSTGHTFSIGEPEWADNPHQHDVELWQRDQHGSPHEEPQDRRPSGYEVRNPSAEHRCHYCRNILPQYRKEASLAAGRCDDDLPHPPHGRCPGIIEPDRRDPVFDSRLPETNHGASDDECPRCGGPAHGGAAVFGDYCPGEADEGWQDDSGRGLTRSYVPEPTDEASLRSHMVSHGPRWDNPAAPADWLSEVHNRLHSHGEGVFHQHDLPGASHDPVFGSVQGRQLIGHFAPQQVVYADVHDQAPALSAGSFTWPSLPVPEDPEGLAEALREMPALVEVLRDELYALAFRLGEEAPLHPSVIDMIFEMAASCRTAQEDMRHFRASSPEGSWEEPGSGPKA